MRTRDNEVLIVDEAQNRRPRLAQDLTEALQCFALDHIFGARLLLHHHVLQELGRDVVRLVERFTQLVGEASARSSPSGSTQTFRQFGRVPFERTFDQFPPVSR